MSKPRKPKSAPAKAKAPKSAQPAPARGARKQRGLATASSAMGEAARQEEAQQAKSRPRKAKAAKAAKPQPSTRVGKKGLVLYVKPEITLALRKLALDNNSNVQRMGHRALELLFAEYGKPLPGAGAEASKKT